MMSEKSKTRDVVLLTGASGCLGFHTLKLLITHDDLCSEIRCLDLRPPDESMRRIIDVELMNHNATAEYQKTIKYFEGDIRDINLVEQISNGVNCIIHCAAKIDIWTENCEQDESELESVNVAGTENLLKAAIRYGIHKFVHVSSFEAYMSYLTVYYATETTMPDTDYLIFGASAKTKKLAEQKVKQYSNNKLSRVQLDGKDSLNAVIIRFPAFYGEYEKYFITKILEITKFFGGTLQQWSNIWVRHQPIYVGNAAWSLIKAKHRMDSDQSVSGEEFHVTDDTPIEDPYKFVEPFLEACGMRLSKRAYNFFLVWLLMYLFFALKRYVAFFDFFGIFSKRNSRLEAAIEQDKLKQNPHLRSELQAKSKPKHWYDIITPQMFGFMCTANFLNRTKASLRLDYEPLTGPEESKKLAQEWYKDNGQS